MNGPISKHTLLISVKENEIFEFQRTTADDFLYTK